MSRRASAPRLVGVLSGALRRDAAVSLGMSILRKVDGNWRVGRPSALSRRTMPTHRQHTRLPHAGLSRSSGESSATNHACRPVVMLAQRSPHEAGRVSPLRPPRTGAGALSRASTRQRDAVATQHHATPLGGWYDDAHRVVRQRERPRPARRDHDLAARARDAQLHLRELAVAITESDAVILVERERAFTGRARMHAKLA